MPFSAPETSSIVVASQALEQVVPVPESKIQAVQYGLAKWFGTSSQKKEAAPVLQDVDLASEKYYSQRIFRGEALQESRNAIAEGIAAEADLLAIATKNAQVHDFNVYGRLGGRPEIPKGDRRGVAGGDSNKRFGA